MQHDIDIARENLATLMNYDSIFMIPTEPMELLLVQVDSLGSDPGYLYWQNARVNAG